MPAGKAGQNAASGARSSRDRGANVGDQGSRGQRQRLGRCPPVARIALPDYPPISRAPALPPRKDAKARKTETAGARNAALRVPKTSAGRSGDPSWPYPLDAPAGQWVKGVSPPNPREGEDALCQNAGSAPPPRGLQRKPVPGNAWRGVSILRSQRSRSVFPGLSAALRSASPSQRSGEWSVRQKGPSGRPPMGQHSPMISGCGWPKSGWCRGNAATDGCFLAKPACWPYLGLVWQAAAVRSGRIARPRAKPRFRRHRARGPDGRAGCRPEG